MLPQAFSEVLLLADISGGVAFRSKSIPCLLLCWRIFFDGRTATFSLNFTQRKYAAQGCMYVFIFHRVLYTIFNFYLTSGLSSSVIHIFWLLYWKILSHCDCHAATHFVSEVGHPRCYLYWPYWLILWASFRSIAWYGKWYFARWGTHGHDGFNVSNPPCIFFLLEL